MTTYILPEMPYKYDALEPHLDARTITSHKAPPYTTVLEKYLIHGLC